MMPGMGMGIAPKCNVMFCFPACLRAVAMTHGRNCATCKTPRRRSVQLLVVPEPSDQDFEAAFASILQHRAREFCSERGRLHVSGVRHRWRCGIRLILDDQRWRNPFPDMTEDALPTVAVDTRIVESALR